MDLCINLSDTIMKNNIVVPFPIGGAGGQQQYWHILIVFSFLGETNNWFCLGSHMSHFQKYTYMRAFCFCGVFLGVKL